MIIVFPVNDFRPLRCKNRALHIHVIMAVINEEAVLKVILIPADAFT